MDLPDNTLLPLFAYGIFQPGNLGFLRIKPFVESGTAAFAMGELFVRDGLPLLKQGVGGQVAGFLLKFCPEVAGKAYFRIVEIEPDRQYTWGTMEVNTSERNLVTANVLVGI